MNKIRTVLSHTRDAYGNPVSGEELEIKNFYGTMAIEDYVTDSNGVVSIRYTAPSSPVKDSILVKCLSNGLNAALSVESI